MKIILFCYSKILLRHFNCLFLLLFLGGNLYSQTRITTELLPDEQFIKFNKLTVNHGLSQNLVIFIHQDVQGFLWFGTAGGLDRFDGSDIKTYNNIKGLKNQPIYYYSVIENRDTIFWFATEYGLMHYNPITNLGQMYSPNKIIGLKDEVLDINHLTRLNYSTLLFGITGFGLFRFNEITKNFSFIYEIKSTLTDNSIDDIIGIIPSSAGNTIVITKKQIISYNLSSGEMKKIFTFPPSIIVTSVLDKRNSDLILMGTTQGIWEINKNNIANENIVLTRFNLLPSSLKILVTTTITALFQDSNGTLWIGTDNFAAAIYKNNLGIIYRNIPYDESSISSGSVKCFFEDNSKNLWISLHDNGLCKTDLKKRKFNTIFDHAGYTELFYGKPIQSIKVDKKDKLWVSNRDLNHIDFSSNNISRYILNLNNSPKEMSNNIKKIFSISDSLLCFINKGNLYLFNTVTAIAKKIKIDNLPDGGIYNSYLRNRTKTIVCATKDSLFEIDPLKNSFLKSIINFSLKPDNKENLLVNVIKENTDGNLWIGTSNGLVNWDENNVTLKFISITSNDSITIPNPTILSLAFSKNNTLWIGTASGLFKYDIVNHIMRGFYIKDGLPNQKIWSIIVDKKNRVWATSNRGLSCLEEQTDGKFKIRNYSIEDGLPSNEFNMNVVDSDSKGNLFFGNGNGLIYFHPDSIEQNQNTSSIVLTGFSYYGVPTTTQKEISYITTLDIPYDKKVFSLKYALLDYTNTTRNSFMYKLQGHDDNWIDAGTKKEAFFTNLDPGKYELIIKAANNDGIWSEHILKINLNIVPPFWMTSWFRGLIIVLVFLVIAGIVRYIEYRKIRRQIEELERKNAVERERSRISKDMHDEIGASLTKISLLGNIASSNVNNSESEKILNRINDSVNETIEKLDEIVWTVNPSNDNLKNLTAYILEYAEKFFEDSNINCRFIFPDNIPDINLTAEIRHNIFLASKEALNNILKYSEAKLCIITLIVGNLSFTFSFKDNGKGFDVNSIPQTSNGIKYMKERIESIGGEFTLTSKNGEGTEIHFSIRI